MASGGMVHSPLPGQAPGDDENAPAGRPTTRKSQIIEEEGVGDIEEEIEEVEEFEEDIAAVRPETDKPEDDAAKGTAEAGSPISNHKPALEPAPELESSPIHPPRSSSLRSLPPEAAAAISHVTGTSISTTQDEDSNQTAAATCEDAPKPTTSSH